MDKIIELNDNTDTSVFYGVNNHNMLCLCKAQSKLITIYLYLYGVTHRGELHHSY